MVQHGGAEATVLPWPPLPMRTSARRGSTGGSSPTRTRAGRGRRRRRPSTPSGRAGCRCHRHRARRPCHRRRGAGRLPRPDGRPHHGRGGGDRRAHRGAAPDPRQRLLVGPRGRRQPRARPRATTRSGGGPRPTAASGSPPSRRCSRSSPTSCSTSTSSGPLPTSPPTRRRWPPCSAGSAARRRHRGLVPGRRHRRLLGVRPGDPDLGRARWPWPPSSRPCRPGRSPAPMRHVALQVPATFGGVPLVDERFVVEAHDRAGRPRLDHRGGGRDGAALRPRGGRHHHRPAHRPGRGAQPPVGRLASGDRVRAPGARASRGPGRGAGHRWCGIGRSGGGRRGPEGSAPAAVRLLAVVGLLLGPELALVGSFRHSSTILPWRRGAGGHHGGGRVSLAAPGRGRAGRRRGGHDRPAPVEGPARPGRLQRGDGLPRHRSVHTLGMRFPIDVAFCDRDMVVVDVTTMVPWRMGRPRRRARTVIEAEAGAFERWGLRRRRPPGATT